MCRRIKVLRTLEPAVTRDDTRGRRDPSRVRAQDKRLPQAISHQRSGLRPGRH